MKQIHNKMIKWMLPHKKHVNAFKFQTMLTSLITANNYQTHTT